MLTNCPVRHTLSILLGLEKRREREKEASSEIARAGPTMISTWFDWKRHRARDRMTSGDLAPRKPRRAEDWQGYRRPFPPRRAANTQWRGMRVHEAFPYRAAVTPIHPPSPAAATTASAASSSTLASSLFSRPSSQRCLSSCSIFYHHLYHRQHPAFRADPKTLQTERTRNECAATFPELSLCHRETENAP